MDGFDEGMLSVQELGELLAETERMVIDTEEELVRLRKLPPSEKRRQQIEATSRTLSSLRHTVKVLRERLG